MNKNINLSLFAPTFFLHLFIISQWWCCRGGGGGTDVMLNPQDPLPPAERIYCNKRMFEQRRRREVTEEVMRCAWVLGSSEVQRNGCWR